jgi:4-hydroxy-tetrahydrodipicolinate reductase
MRKVNILIVGASGRMGQALIQEIAGDKDLVLVAAIDRESSEKLGRDAGEALGILTGVKIDHDINRVISSADVLIDFTRPDASLEYLKFCEAHHVKYVIGTTGFSDQEKKMILDASKTIPIVFSPNMSVGINLLISLVEKATQLLKDDFDIEIIEAHHRHIIDAPSGTALRLGEVVAKVCGRDLKKDALYERSGNTGARRQTTIGFSTIRGGDIVGDHTILYAGMGERIELIHRASSRATFAKGALRAAKFLSQQKAGLFDMQKVLGLSDN